MRRNPGLEGVKKAFYILIGATFTIACTSDFVPIAQLVLEVLLFQSL